MTLAANLALACGAAAVGGLALGTYSGVREPIELAIPTSAHARAAVARPPKLAEPVPVPAARAVAAPDPRAVREALVARIRDPGHGHEAWHDSARAILGGIGELAIGATDQGCYMAGCTATFTFASTALLDSALATTPGYAVWTGGAHATPPEQLAGGGVVVAVVLERPD